MLFIICYQRITKMGVYFRNQMKNQHCQSRLIKFFSVHAVYFLLVFSCPRDVDVPVQVLGPNVDGNITMSFQLLLDFFKTLENCDVI